MQEWGNWGELVFNHVVVTRQGLKVIPCLWCINHGIALGVSHKMTKEENS